VFVFFLFTEKCYVFEITQRKEYRGLGILIPILVKTKFRKFGLFHMTSLSFHVCVRKPHCIKEYKCLPHPA